MLKLNTTEKLNIISVPKAIKTATIDYLLSLNKNIDISKKAASLAEKIAKEMDLIPIRLNENNLYQKKLNLSNKKVLNS